MSDPKAEGRPRAFLSHVSLLASNVSGQAGQLTPVRETESTGDAATYRLYTVTHRGPSPCAQGWDALISPVFFGYPMDIAVLKAPGSLCQS